MNYDSRWQNLQEEHIVPLSEKAYLAKHSLKQVGKEMEAQVRQKDTWESFKRNHSKV